MGATPTVLSLEDASIKDMEDLIKKEKPDAVIFSAGAGGKGGPERTRAVDYEGSVKVYEACQGAGVKRLLLVSAFDVRDRSNPVPEWYTKEDIEACSRVWAAIGHCESLTILMRKLTTQTCRPSTTRRRPFARPSSTIQFSAPGTC